jgi:DNA-binding NtrC family response regulator
MQPGSLLLVDDDRRVLESMADWLREQGYRVDVANSYATAVAAVDKKPYDVVLADIRLGDGDGFDLLAYCQKHHPSAAVILLTGYGTAETAVEAIRAGAFDFLTKPLIDEELEMSIERVLSQRHVIEENKNLKSQLDRRVSIDNIVGRDHRMTKVFELMTRRPRCCSAAKAARGNR